VAHQAQDTFIAEIDGSPLLVQKGQVFADSHKVVKLDAGRGVLFTPLDLDDEPPPKSAAKAAARPGKAS
jgi:hypothetical protein